MKAKLLAALAEARAREAELDVLCTNMPRDPGGHWHPKDHLAHLAWWRRRNAQLFDAIKTDGELPPSLEDGEQNAVIYESYCDQPLAEIRDLSLTSWEELTEAAEGLTESDLMKPHPYASGQLLWQEVGGTTFYHLGEHLTYVHEELGDELRAEAAQTWMHDMHIGLAPDDRQRGTAEYNLGCFYAKRGRADEAVPLLRKGIELRPELRDWAKEDSDLDPIRETEELKALLAT